MPLSVGQQLRQARLDQGWDYATVAARTKISEKYLKAIEAEDRASFPGGFFYKSFVHQYARALSVDTQEIDAAIDEALSADAPLPLPGQQGEIIRHVEPLIARRGAMRARMVASLVVLVIALAACSGFYVWWRKGQVGGGSTVVVAASKPKPAQRQAATPASIVAAVPVSLNSDQQAAKPPSDAAAQPSPGSKVLLDVLAVEATWLSASSDGKMVFQGILAPHDSKTIEGKEVAKLRVGNAGGVEVRLNGKPLGPLGARGQVLVVVFRPDKFEIVQPPKESD
jgi:cytoskeletal protein RodZ